MAHGKHILGMPKGKHIFATVKVGEKGQIVIPKEARLRYNINPGDTLLVLGDDELGVVISRPDVIPRAACSVFGSSTQKTIQENEKGV